MGRNSGRSPGTQLLSLRPFLLFPLPMLPILPFRHPAPRAFSAGASLLTSVVERKPSTAWLHLPSASRSRVLNQLLPPPSFLPHLCPQDLLQGLPLGAHLEEVISCLRPVLAPPAPSGGPVLRPVKVLPREAATCRQLVEPQGEPPGAANNRAVQLLLAWHPVFLSGGLAPNPLSCFRPLLLRDLPLGWASVQMVMPSRARGRRAVVFRARAMTAHSAP